MVVEVVEVERAATEVVVVVGTATGQVVLVLGAQSSVHTSSATVVPWVLSHAVVVACLQVLDSLSSWFLSPIDCAPRTRAHRESHGNLTLVGCAYLQGGM